MKRKLQQWWSIQRAKNPGSMVLGMILLFNILFFLISATVISALDLDGTEGMDILHAAFCTLTMILDAGCIQFVITDIGKSGVFVSLFCLTVVLIGMISFTGAVIGYFTNYISHFIDSAHAGKNKVVVSNHIVILNWNSRASEIINDYLYAEEKHNIIVLVNSRKEEIQQEIEERISATVSRENRKLERKYAHLPLRKRLKMLRRHRFRRKVTVLVREGDVFSSKQLRDISLDQARSIIILGNEVRSTSCRYENRELSERHGRGNSQTVKTLMQVLDITASSQTEERQKIIVEVTDSWTKKLVDGIIRGKQAVGNRDIIPVRVNEILGQLLSQVSLMPDLNSTYGELFSIQGVEFHSARQDVEEDIPTYFRNFYTRHRHAIPLASMDYKGESYCYYAAECAQDLTTITPNPIETTLKVRINPDYRMPERNIILLGHNSKCSHIMQGYRSFCEEWNNDGEPIISVLVIDDKKHLEKVNYYREFPFVVETVEADIYDEKLICETLEAYISKASRPTSVLILSDDISTDEDVDSNALANLVYVQNILNRKRDQGDPVVDLIDMVVELVDPKHHDIVSSYSVDNMVISNRYISRMIVQIGEVDALFDFYVDILTYDDQETDSNEIYIKTAGEYFTELPGKTTAEQLIRAVFEATSDPSLPEEQRNMTALLGYINREGQRILFSGDQSAIEVELDPMDKMILFADH